MTISRPSFCCYFFYRIFNLNSKTVILFVYSYSCLYQKISKTVFAYRVKESENDGVRVSGPPCTASRGPSTIAKSLVPFKYSTKVHCESTSARVILLSDGQHDKIGILRNFLVGCRTFLHSDIFSLDSILCPSISPWRGENKFSSCENVCNTVQ